MIGFVLILTTENVDVIVSVRSKRRVLSFLLINSCRYREQLRHLLKTSSTQLLTFSVMN
jgi:hypothetical protein